MYLCNLHQTVVDVLADALLLVGQKKLKIISSYFLAK